MELSRDCVSYREKSTLIKRNPCYPYRREDLRSFPAQLALSRLVRRPSHAAPWWCRLRKCLHRLPRVVCDPLTGQAVSRKVE
ncbi:protein of unknown function [Cupriavidus taiwanensis]|nr:protein of unknown function [Cupriavidus taiwanensis]